VVNCGNYHSCMIERVSTIDVRRRIGDLVNRVALRHDEFIIERKGKSLAALVPVERLEQMRRFARRHALDFLERQAGGPLSDELAMELGAEARRWARRSSKQSDHGTI
jgi:prevent-host-death family protein